MSEHKKFTAGDVKAIFAKQAEHDPFREAAESFITALVGFINAQIDSAQTHGCFEHAHYAEEVPEYTFDMVSLNNTSNLPELLSYVKELDLRLDITTHEEKDKTPYMKFKIYFREGDNYRYAASLLDEDLKIEKALRPEQQMTPAKASITVMANGAK